MSKYTKPVSALRLETVGAALPSRLMVTLSSEFVDSHMMIVRCKLAFFHFNTQRILSVITTIYTAAHRMTATCVCHVSRPTSAATRFTNVLPPVGRHGLGRWWCAVLARPSSTPTAIGRSRHRHAIVIIGRRRKMYAAP